MSKKSQNHWLLLATGFGIISTVGISFYALFRMGISLHHDEWVGRGLYPGLALGHGFDLYEPVTGPHVTLYGFGTALFYSLTALSSNPNQAIWFAYVINLIGFSVPIAFISNRILSKEVLDPRTRYFSIFGFTKKAFL